MVHFMPADGVCKTASGIQKLLTHGVLTIRLGHQTTLTTASPAARRLTQSRGRHRGLSKGARSGVRTCRRTEIAFDIMHIQSTRRQRFECLLSVWPWQSLADKLCLVQFFAKTRSPAETLASLPCTALRQ